MLGLASNISDSQSADVTALSLVALNLGALYLISSTDSFKSPPVPACAKSIFIFSPAPLIVTPVVNEFALFPALALQLI